MSAESWPIGIREAVDDFRRDVPKIMNGEFVCVPNRLGVAPRTMRRTISDLHRIAGRHYGVRPTAIKGKSRQQEICRARFICWHILHAVNGWTATRIGKAYDRDHTSISNGWQRYEDFCYAVGGYRETAERIKAEWVAVNV